MKVKDWLAAQHCRIRHKDKHIVFVREGGVPEYMTPDGSWSVHYSEAVDFGSCAAARVVKEKVRAIARERLTS